VKVPGGVVSTPGAADREGVDMDEDNDVAEIAAFIEARIAEEEADARAATPGPWAVNDVEDDHRAGVLDAENNCLIEWYACGEDDARHIVRQNPAVTLPRCEMTRGLLGEFRGAAEWAEHPDCPDREREGYRRTAGTLRSALRYVAAFYRLRPDGSQHPDYRKEWAVT
jgi:hypothetical protein